MIHHDPEKTAFSREFFKLEQYVVNVSQESAFRLFLRSLYLPRLSLGSCKKTAFSVSGESDTDERPHIVNEAE